MDTRFFEQALASYRAKTGDQRPWASLPGSARSQIMMAAQNLKFAECIAKGGKS
jgi:hypothetical protein